MFEKLNNKHCRLSAGTRHALAAYEPWLRRVGFKPVVLNNFEVVLQNQWYTMKFEEADTSCSVHRTLRSNGTAEEILREVYNHVYHGDWYVYVGSEVICPLQHYKSALNEDKHFVELRDILRSYRCDMVTKCQTSVEWCTEDGRMVTLTDKASMSAVSDTLRGKSSFEVAPYFEQGSLVDIEGLSYRDLGNRLHGTGCSGQAAGAMRSCDYSKLEQYVLANRDTLTGKFKQQPEEIKMNVLDLVAAANLHMVSVRFSTTPGRTYEYKSEVAHEPGSKVVVDSPSSGLVVVEVAACVKGLQAHSDFPKYKWIVAAVDDSRYKELLEKEELAIKTIAAKQRAEKVKKELEGLGVSQEELLQLLGLAKGD